MTHVALPHVVTEDMSSPTAACEDVFGHLMWQLQPWYARHVVGHMAVFYETLHMCLEPKHIRRVCNTMAQGQDHHNYN